MKGQVKEWVRERKKEDTEEKEKKDREQVSDREGETEIKKLATIVEGDPKARLSIATTPRCRGKRYSIPWIAPLYPWTVPYNAEC